MLDNHKPLIFKDYLMAQKNDPITQSHENLYAPFYLWHNTEGMQDFISGVRFVGVANSFGWPVVRTWPSVIVVQQTTTIIGAQFATREITQIAPFTNLEELRNDERRWDTDQKALLVLLATVYNDTN